jgi:hypothetical protein
MEKDPAGRRARLELFSTPDGRDSRIYAFPDIRPEPPPRPVNIC